MFYVKHIRVCDVEMQHDKKRKRSVKAMRVKKGFASSTKTDFTRLRNELV
jgi:hypothetical protein